MNGDLQTSETSSAGGYVVLAVLSAAMFVYVIDTTLMNVSISALVEDLNTTVGEVQTAITLYTLTMASFMLTGGKLGRHLGVEASLPYRAHHLRHRHHDYGVLPEHRNADRHLESWLLGYKRRGRDICEGFLRVILPVGGEVDPGELTGVGDRLGAWCRAGASGDDYS